MARLDASKKRLVTRTLRLDPDEWKIVEKIAKRRKITPAAIVREAITYYIVHNSAD